MAWTRDEFQLPASGELCLTYKSTPFTPKFEHAMRPRMVTELATMMQHRVVADHGLKLLILAALEFYFTCEDACTLVLMMPDTASRVEAASALVPWLVDPVNLHHELYNYLSDREVNGIEAKLGLLFSYVPVSIVPP